MEQLVVECLRCGHQRSLGVGPRPLHATEECPRCRYVGWAEANALSEETRGRYRAHPLEERLRLRVVGARRGQCGVGRLRRR